jgi:crossover junction endodeoxyribonuclease RuvC
MTVSNRYLGIDPGLSRTGYALIERTGRGLLLRGGGAIQTKTDQPRICGWVKLPGKFAKSLQNCGQGPWGIEQVFSHARNVRSSLLLAQARGAILATVAENPVPLIQYSPSQIKQMLTGSGRAGKEQMQHAVRAELRLAEILEPHDVADAAAVALCLFHSLRFAA